jgi:hypothetical protein
MNLYFKLCICLQWVGLSLDNNFFCFLLVHDFICLFSVQVTCEIKLIDIIFILFLSYKCLIMATLAYIIVSMLLSCRHFFQIRSNGFIFMKVPKQTTTNIFHQCYETAPNMKIVFVNCRFAI